MGQKRSVELDLDIGQYTFSDHLFIKLYIYCTNNISIAQIIFYKFIYE